MRYPPLHVGELVQLYHTDIYGVIICERRTGVYDIHVFRDNRMYTFPRGMIEKINQEDKKCP